jgi:RNA polymerase sigma-70 factor (ECF subfamily)
MGPGERESLRARLTELADGDRAAFDDVYERVWPLVRGFVGRHLRSGEAEDVAQEALLRVFSRASEFDRDRDALAWILGIAAWEIRTHRTRQRRRREESLDEEKHDRDAADPSPEEAAVHRERDRLVVQAIAALGPSDAATLESYMSDERPPIAPATFRKRVQRAVERARALMRSHESPR